MGVKQGTPSGAVQLRHLVWDMRRRAVAQAAHSSRMHRIDSGRGRLLRDTLYTGKRVVKVSVAVVSHLLQMTGGERFIFNSFFGTMLRSSSQAVVARKSLDCREI